MSQASTTPDRKGYLTGKKGCVIMIPYDSSSRKAEEFINDSEIQDTLRYAEENKHNVELIDAILEKARPRRENGILLGSLPS